MVRAIKSFAQWDSPVSENSANLIQPTYLPNLALLNLAEINPDEMNLALGQT